MEKVLKENTGIILFYLLIIILSYAWIIRVNKINTTINISKEMPIVEARRA